ncbi:hypothetical protein G3545_19995 [Starkeya sp. ORNL1]|nr:hypothetical protein [Starkeya sp. ORNL1]QJP15734.1 hypothetical protein G3545_19995 [Starkeya sp. ORNL1]
MRVVTTAPGAVLSLVSGRVDAGRRKNLLRTWLSQRQPDGKLTRKRNV